MGEKGEGVGGSLESMSGERGEEDSGGGSGENGLGIQG